MIKPVAIADPLKRVMQELDESSCLVRDILNNLPRGVQTKDSTQAPDLSDFKIEPHS